MIMQLHTFQHSSNWERKHISVQLHDGFAQAMQAVWHGSTLNRLGEGSRPEESGIYKREVVIV